MVRSLRKALCQSPSDAPRRDGGGCSQYAQSALRTQQDGEAVSSARAGNRLRFDQAVVAQDRDPGIPMTAARLLAERGSKLVRQHRALALHRECAQDIGGGCRQSLTPEIQTFGRGGGCRARLPGRFQTGLGHADKVVGLVDIAAVAQLLAAGIEMPATRLETGQGCKLAPGEPARRVLRGSNQQLPRSALNIIARTVIC